MASRTGLKVHGAITSRGLELGVNGRRYDTKFPAEIWQATPPDVKQALLENLTFGNTHFLPLVLGGSKIEYDTRLPCFESQLFRNQVGDLLQCELTDGVALLSYLRDFYNLDLRFAPGESCVPAARPRPGAKSRRPTAVIPFSFGKESLATLALCLELGIRPVLVYCQEPSQPFEERYKRRKLDRLGADLGIPAYFIEHAPGTFRYGTAFRGIRGARIGSEVGWGAQTTLLALLCAPFAHAHAADFVLFGNECSNNEAHELGGWKVHSSFDQSSFWTPQQSNMLRILTGGTTHVYSVLEPLEEIGIFSMLHNRYPELGRHQFSCSAEKPLVRGSQWCHQCYKCDRMFLFAEVCGLDASKIGFKRDLLLEKRHFRSYFDGAKASGSRQELDFSFYGLHRKKRQSAYSKRFEEEKLPALDSWRTYRDYFTRLRTEGNLPPAFRSRMLTIFNGELKRFSRALPG